MVKSDGGEMGWVDMSEKIIAADDQDVTLGEMCGYKLLRKLLYGSGAETHTCKYYLPKNEIGLIASPNPLVRNKQTN